MKKISAATILTTLLVCSASCFAWQGEAKNSTVASDQDDPVEVRANNWLESRLENGLVLVEVLEDQGFAVNAINGSNSVMLNLDAQDYRITVGFKASVTSDTTLEELRKNFKYIALDKLPTPGLSEEGWEITPRTPVSSFQEGVEILDFRDGNITLRVKTRFFALGGRNTQVRVPADAPMPAGSYFQFRKDFDLDLTIVAPVEIE